jgi:NADPH-dependent ferric siderophore reductase
MQPTSDAERNASHLARPRRRPAPLRATVSEKTQLSLHLVRVTLTGPDLAGFNYPGPASHFKLVLPDPTWANSSCLPLATTGWSRSTGHRR